MRNRILKKHIIEKGTVTLCGRLAAAVEGRIVQTETSATCGYCLRVLKLRKIPRAHDDPEYWNKHRARCIAEGRCHKCKNKLYKWGMCRKHYKALKMATERRRPKKPRRVNGKRAFDCSRCGGEGHSVLTCQR